MTYEDATRNPDACVAAVEIRTASLLFEDVLTRRAAAQEQGVRQVSSRLEAIFRYRLEEIEAQARVRLRLGAPPSLRLLTGISQLEVPMNRVLGWIFDPSRRGDAACIALTELARFLEFETLLRDIEAGEVPEVLVESSPDVALTNRQPDLMIGTTNAALLIENKVDSPESGEGQYADYLSVLTDWAKSRDARAYLFSRRKRTPPAGWAGSFSHQDLGVQIFRRLAEEETSLPFWDRVVYGLLAGDLDPDLSMETPAEIAQVLAGRQSPVVRATSLSRLIQRPTIDLGQGSADVG